MILNIFRKYLQMKKKIHFNFEKYRKTEKWQLNNKYFFINKNNDTQ
jgi:hypothetical protein